MQKFLSCDWGTTSLRVRLVDATKQIVLAEAMSKQGISDTCKLWMQRGHGEEKRIAFYCSILKKVIIELEKQSNFSLRDVPLIISGMASSSIGMMELPYQELPISLDKHNLHTKEIHETEDFPHRIILISGVRTKNDVMRGEETQLLGCDANFENEQILIFPGTHSKHVFVGQNKLVDFKTYMTGEFFNLLSTQSLLSNTVEDVDIKVLDGNNLGRFEEGVSASRQSNLLHTSFLVRTNYLLGNYTKEENYYYLSGLLIGTELKELSNRSILITVVGNQSITEYYSKALQKLGMPKVNTLDADAAVIKGHCKIYSEITGN